MKKIALLFLLFASALQSASYEEVVDQNSYQVLTPSLQKRKTAKIRLKNGLEAYLVSDPDANQSAAALSFEVGSWNDDPKYPGIAHFLEHLLFLGSETYPEENAYDKQVWDNGGTLNAYTAPDRTVYIFSVNNDAFPTTLDMFSHMFTDPLFSPSGVGRELHAVDQEHDKNIENDGNRAWMIFKETGNPSHPNALFSTGNLETMKGIPPSVVRQWFEKNYHANEAHLSLYSTLPLEELKEMTVRLFSSLPEGERRKTGIDEPLFSKHQEGHIIAIKPVKEIRELSIEWELPREYAANLDASADHLLGYVLRSKHEGSLYTKLKEEGLIDSLSSGIMRAGKENALFSISFDLTPLGAKHFYRVIDQCFATLNNLKNEGIPPYIFQEKKTIALIDYQYQSRIAPYQFVQGHAHSMIDEPLETYPMKSQLFSSYRPEEGEAFLKLLKPEQAAYFLIASPELTGIPPNKKERWLGAEYSLQKISEEALKRWETLSENSLSPLPKQNPYIPTELTLKHQGGSEKLVTPEPTRVIEKERGVLYFWGDTQYHVPEVSWRFFLSTPAIDGSPRQSVLLDLYCSSLNDKLATHLTEATAASLYLGCGRSDMKFVISVDGYSEKAPLLLQTTLREMKELRVTKKEFERYVTLLSDLYANMDKEMPLIQANEQVSHLLFNHSPLQSDKLAVLQEITYEEVNAFSEKFLQEGYLEAMLIGNLTQEEAVSVFEMADETLGCAPYPPKYHEQKELLTLSPFQGPFKITARTESLGNAAILVIQEGPMTFPKKASQMVLGTTLQDDFFDTLRTKQQTAYIAKTGSFEEEEQLYKMFLVQSSSHQPDELIARFELFLESYIKDFETILSEGRFEVIRRNLITQLETPPTNLASMGGYLSALAFNYKGDFQRREKLITALKELTYETLKQDTAASLSRKNSRRIALMLEGNQPEGKAFRYEGITAETLKSEGTYISIPRLD